MYDKLEMYIDIKFNRIGNIGIGGYGCIIHDKNDTIGTFGGYLENTSEEPLLIAAVLEGLESLEKSYDITIYSYDSSFVDGVNKFISDLAKPDSRGVYMKNFELASGLECHNVVFKKIRRPAGNNKYKYMCSQIALRNEIIATNACKLKYGL